MKLEGHFVFHYWANRPYFEGTTGGGVDAGKRQILDSMDIAWKKISSSKVERTQYTKKSVRMNTLFWGNIISGQIVKTI